MMKLFLMALLAAGCFASITGSEAGFNTKMALSFNTGAMQFPPPFDFAPYYYGSACHLHTG